MLFLKTFFLMFAKLIMLSFQQILISLDADFWYFKGREFKIFYPLYVFKELRYVHKVISMSFINYMKKYSSFCLCRNFLIKIHKLRVEFHDEKIISADLNSSKYLFTNVKLSRYWIVKFFDWSMKLAFQNITYWDLS